MTDPAFFGYGSLVNLATHSYAQPRPARLHGWRRMWQSTSVRDIAFLSVVPDPNCVIAGVIAQVPNADWAALDLREAAYNRHDITSQIQDNGAAASTAVYQVDPNLHLDAQTRHPILLSYLDVVVQGYLQMFGAEGVAAFFETTDGWGPILDDRAAPQYPRAQKLNKDETALVDDHLRNLATI
ncbi:gamma-glutamylcyclotransferase family protein [Loktanella sp. S4079]|uniref:gamma-glutamylcyclotransferase family protein n=1 Tax=Loktanella sp. S4079 TaxID=579483 RepID=UPI0005FA4FC5|nr:gamma-glutamylcyclotransferase family protein [Loktanella sp. S4079]KJZ18333.1 hypothetical protein TW80_15535 [Loktanella sp. S4079]